MQVTHKDQAISRNRQDTTKILSFLFDEYEIHYNELPPKAKQVWHSHNEIEEAVFVIDGPLDVLYIDGEKEEKETLQSKDVVRFEKTVHTLQNPEEKVCTFLAFKLVLEGKDKKDLFAADKKIHNPH